MNNQQYQKELKIYKTIIILMAILSVITTVLIYKMATFNSEPNPSNIINDKNALITPIPDVVKTSDNTIKNEIIQTSIVHLNEPIECEVIDMSIDMSYDFDLNGYTIANLNIRSAPDTRSEIIGYFPIYTDINYSYYMYDDDWYVVKFNDTIAYVSSKYISDGIAPKITNNEVVYADYIEKDVIGDRRKSYMDYTAISNKASIQWLLQSNYASTDNNGIRTVNGRYCIALGSYYTHDIGQYVDLVLFNGIVIPCIIGDNKDNSDTINNNALGADGSAAEFIVDSKTLSKMTKQMGDVSYNDNNWKSNIKSIKVYSKNLFD